MVIDSGRVSFRLNKLLRSCETSCLSVIFLLRINRKVVILTILEIIDNGLGESPFNSQFWNVNQLQYPVTAFTFNACYHSDTIFDRQ